MPETIQDAAEFRKTTGHAGRRFVVNDHHGLNGMAHVCAQPGFKIGGRSAPAPIPGNVVEIETEPFPDLPPYIRELTRLENDYSIACGQRINQSCLDGSGSR